MHYQNVNYLHRSDIVTLQLKDNSLLKTKAYIDGQWCDANDGGRFDVTNPATGKVIATVPDMGADETRTAIETAASRSVG